MTSTVTIGELKIIEANIRGLGNKDTYVKEFLQRRKKKADICCLVEHKISQRSKLNEHFSGGKYRVGASCCRGTGGPGGGVAILVHERLQNVQDSEDEFRTEFQYAREKGIDIAAIKLNLKPKDCQAGLFVFSFYRRPANYCQLSHLIIVIGALIKKSIEEYNSTSIFTGDFNFNNTKEGQRTRSDKDHELIREFNKLQYKLTHTQTSHVQGSALNNFLVPMKMKCSKKTLIEGFRISSSHNAMKKAKEPDHCPIQIIVSLKDQDPQPQHFLRNTQPTLNRGNEDLVVNAPGTSGTQTVPNSSNETHTLQNSTSRTQTVQTVTSGTQTVQNGWSEENGVITILDSDDDEASSSHTCGSLRTNNNLNQERPSNIDRNTCFSTSQAINTTRIKEEGESRSGNVSTQQASRGVQGFSSQPGINYRPTNTTTQLTGGGEAQTIQRSHILNTYINHPGMSEQRTFDRRPSMSSMNPNLHYSGTQQNGVGELQTTQRSNTFDTSINQPGMSKQRTFNQGPSMSSMNSNLQHTGTQHNVVGEAQTTQRSNTFDSQSGISEQRTLIQRPSMSSMNPNLQHSSTQQNGVVEIKTTQSSKTFDTYINQPGMSDQRTFIQRPSMSSINPNLQHTATQHNVGGEAQTTQRSNTFDNQPGVSEQRKFNQRPSMSLINPSPLLRSTALQAFWGIQGQAVEGGPPVVAQEVFSVLAGPSSLSTQVEDTNVNCLKRKLEELRWRKRLKEIKLQTINELDDCDRQEQEIMEQIENIQSIENREQPII